MNHRNKGGLPELGESLALVAKDLPQLLKDAPARISRGEEVIETNEFTHMSVYSTSLTRRAVCIHPSHNNKSLIIDLPASGISKAAIKDTPGYKEIVSACAEAGARIDLSLLGGQIKITPNQPFKRRFTLGL
jgi:hypothetical protein